MKNLIFIIVIFLFSCTKQNDIPQPHPEVVKFYFDGTFKSSDSTFIFFHHDSSILDFKFARKDTITNIWFTSELHWVHGYVYVTNYTSPALFDTITFVPNFDVGYITYSMKYFYNVKTENDFANESKKYFGKITLLK